MKLKILIILCALLLLLSGCNTKYQRISFDDDTLGEKLSALDNDTLVINNATETYPKQIPIYKIIENDISEQEYRQMLEALDLPDKVAPDDLEKNSLYYNLVNMTDFSRGYFNMSEEEAIKQAWEVLDKIFFLTGEYECVGLDDMFYMVDSEGRHTTRAGVVFRRVVDGLRVSGGDKCVIYFDGSGLVAIKMHLFDYIKIGTMTLVPMEEAEARIKTPDSFTIEANFGKANTLQVDNVNLRLVNQYSSGCTILQPVYNFVGTAIKEDGSKAEFISRIIAIPESYTYEKETTE